MALEKSDQINELSTALSKAQGEMEAAKKDATNPHFKSKYATLAAVWEAARAPLAKNGLSVIQSLSIVEKQIHLTTVLAHSSGQWISGIVPVVAEKQTPQGIGSAITYFRRFSLSAMIGVAPDDDDDGNGAEGKPPVEPPKFPKAQAKANPTNPTWKPKPNPLPPTPTSGPGGDFPDDMPRWDD